MRGTAKLANVDDTSLTITLTATVKEWRTLATEMGTKYPQWQFAACIGQALRKMFAQVDVEQEVAS